MFHPSYHPPIFPSQPKGLKEEPTYAHVLTFHVLFSHTTGFLLRSPLKGLSLRPPINPAFLNGIYFPILLFLYCFMIFESGVTVAYIPEPSDV